MDKIVISGLELYGFHGVYAEEKKLGQQFIIDVELFFSTQIAGLNDDIDVSLNYGEVAVAIKRWFEEESYDLIEAIAENIAIKLLKSYPVLEKVTIKVSKPHAPVPLPFQDISCQITRSRHRAIVALGSNLGNRQEYLESAIQAMNADPSIEVIKVSKFIETEPVGVIDQPKFLNGVAIIETFLTPHNLLKTLQEIEHSKKRTRDLRWGPRTLDLDIIYFDDMILQTETLTVPHPRLYERSFVLEPLNEISPKWIDPIYHQPIEMIYADFLKKGPCDHDLPTNSK